MEKETIEDKIKKLTKEIKKDKIKFPRSKIKGTRGGSLT